MTKEQFLQDTIDYYSVDPENRRCINGTTCAYSPANANKEGKSEGCAIGRHLSPEVQTKFDKGINCTPLNLTIFAIMNNQEARKLLPEWMQKMDASFLSDVQCLHDINTYWDSNALSNKGKERVNTIIAEHKLSTELFSLSK